MGFDKLFNNLAESSSEKNSTTMSGIYARQMNKPMLYKEYDDILQNESDKREAKYNGLSYEKDWVDFSDKLWSSVPGHKHGFVYVCPELKVLWPLIKKETDINKSSEIIRKFLYNNVVMAESGVTPDISRVVAVDTNKVYENEKYCKYWFSSTIKGVNIRPGIVGLKDGDGHDADNTEPLHMDDMNPHGLMAGRTGAGKSVALNTIIASLLQEFPPWELDIYLADFKIVEMSRYGQTGFEAPHVSKIAATEAMEYVVSVMYEMYESMSLRQSFFAAVGVQNIKDYRKKFGVVLPHVVLIVDEFQQMYELASGKQTDIINQLIKMVTKLGRATGYHLLFASQSMSGTLSNDVQSNFKMRICLPATEDVSSAVLGNKASAELRGKGYCWTNCEGGAIESNIKYRVPFLRSETENPEDLTELQEILKWNKELSNIVGYARPMNFFRDSAIRSMHESDSSVRSFEEDIRLFRQGVQDVVDSDQEIEDILLLGDSYVYKEPKGKNFDVTLEYFRLKIGDGKNILILGDSPYQRAYMTELLAMQYATRGNVNQNIVVNADNVMSDIYNINDTFTDYGTSKPTEILHKDFIRTFSSKCSTRMIINDYVQYVLSEERKSFSERASDADMDLKLLRLVCDNKISSDEKRKFVDHDPENITLSSALSIDEFLGRYSSYIIEGKYDDMFDSLCDDEMKYVEENDIDDMSLDDKIKSFLRMKNDILIEGASYIGNMYNALKNMYVSGVKDGKFSFKNMPTLTFWVLGFNNISSIAGERNQAGKISEMMKNCTNYGIRTVFVGTQVRDISELSRTFGYILIQSANDTNYSKYDMIMSKEIKDNVVRFKAVNDVLTNVKPHLYPLPNDEKMFKVFDREYSEENSDDFFRCF